MNRDLDQKALGLTGCKIMKDTETLTTGDAGFPNLLFHTVIVENDAQFKLRWSTEHSGNIESRWANDYTVNGGTYASDSTGVAKTEGTVVSGKWDAITMFSGVVRLIP